MAQARDSTARILDLRDYRPHKPEDDVQPPAPEQAPDDLASQVSTTGQDYDDYWSQPARRKSTTAHDAVFDPSVVPVFHQPLFPPEVAVPCAPLFPVEAPPGAEESAPVDSSAPKPAVDHDALWDELRQHAESTAEKPVLFSRFVTVPFALGSLGVAFVFSVGFAGLDPYIALAEEAGALSAWLWQTSLDVIASA